MFVSKLTKNLQCSILSFRFCDHTRLETKKLLAKDVNLKVRTIFIPHYHSLKGCHFFVVETFLSWTSVIRQIEELIPSLCSLESL